jgi:hypothetical protein
MKEIDDLFKQMTEDDLIQAVTEIEESQETGFIKEDGVVRKYHQLSCDIFDQVQMFTTLVNILSLGALRWKPKEVPFPEYLILSGEGSYDTEHQFVVGCHTLDEANTEFDNFKNGTYKETELSIYHGTKIRKG